MAVYKPDYVLFHHPCTDGITAAAVVKRYYGDDDSIEYLASDYGKNQNIDDQLDLFRDKKILLVDFSFKKPMIEKFMSVVDSMLILDHHKTAQADLEDYEWQGDVVSALNISTIGDALLEQKVIAVFDMNESGASLSWKFFNPNSEMPIFVQYVKDNDIAQYKLPRTSDFKWFSRSIPFVIDEVEPYIDTTQSELEKQFDDGVAIKRFVDVRMAELMKQVKWGTIHKLNFPYIITDYAFASEAATELVADGNSMAMGVYFTADGMGLSLRSKAPFDCSAIAKEFGGGGHAQAAGVNIMWKDLPGFIVALEDGGVIHDSYTNPEENTITLTKEKEEESE